MRTQAERQERSQAHVAAWQANLMTMVTDRQKGHRRNGQTTIAVRVWTQFIRYLDAAALTRSVTRSTYIRRHLVVAMAHDLSLDPRVIAHASISPDAMFNGEHPRQNGRDYLPTRDDGAGIEDWCPHPGCDGSHLR